MFLKIKFATFCRVESRFSWILRFCEFFRKLRFLPKIAIFKSQQKSIFNTPKCSKFNLKKHLVWHFFENFGTLFRFFAIMVLQEKPHVHPPPHKAQFSTYYFFCSRFVISMLANLAALMRKFGRPSMHYFWKRPPPPF